MATNKKKEIKNTIGDGGCPCGEYDDGETKIKSHCWRTTNNCDCPYAGVHYKGKLSTAKRIAKEISEDYSCEVKILK